MEDVAGQINALEIKGGATINSDYFKNLNRFPAHSEKYFVLLFSQKTASMVGGSMEVYVYRLAHGRSGKSNKDYYIVKKPFEPLILITDGFEEVKHRVNSNAELYKIADVFYIKRFCILEPIAFAIVQRLSKTGVLSLLQIRQTVLSVEIGEYREFDLRSGFTRD